MSEFAGMGKAQKEIGGWKHSIDPDLNLGTMRLLGRDEKRVAD